MSPAGGESQRLRRLLAVGVLLGLATVTGVAVFVAPEPVFGALGEVMSGPPPGREPPLASEPASGPVPAPPPERAEPVVHVCTDDATDVASTNRPPPSTPATGEGEPHTTPRAERAPARPAPSRASDARDAATSTTPGLPVPNPWDVSTFGGRS